MPHALGAARAGIDGYFIVAIICFVISLAIAKDRITTLGTVGPTRAGGAIHTWIARPARCAKSQNPSKRNRCQSDECIQTRVTNVSDIFLVRAIHSLHARFLMGTWLRSVPCWGVYWGQEDSGNKQCDYYWSNRFQHHNLVKL